MTVPAIQTHELTKRYGSTLAVDGLTIRVAPGEIYGFLGLNGAGTSTTVRLLLGLTRPSRGAALLFGGRVSGGGVGPWRRVGYLVDAAHADPGLTVGANLELARRLHGVTDPGAVDRAIELLGLTDYRDRRAGVLSQGNLQRLGLARALLHQPELLILDEPINGLDPAGIVEVRELLRRLAREHGVTVFISSHILAEVARLATRIAIIDQGRLLAELDADDLERRSHPRLLIDARDRAVGGLLAVGVVTAWVFGREFSDRMAVDLLALPTPRAAIVTAKFLLIVAWSAVVTALVPLVALVVGGALGLPGWSTSLLWETVGHLAVLSGLNTLLLTPVALAASIGRGYLPAIGLVLIVIALAQAMAAIGAGAWFPWSVPALASGMAGAAGGAISATSYLLVGLTVLAGAVLTMTWWRLADQR